MEKFREKIKTKGFFACKNMLSDKSVTILSCGPSIEDFKGFINKKPNTIIATIKTATNYSKGEEDFFFYDNRIFDGHRHNFKYNLNKKSIKVFTHDYLNEENEKEKVKRVNSEVKKDIDMCVYPEAPPFCIKNCKIRKSEKKKNRIYYDGNILMPIVIRVILFFIKLGVRKFRLFGVNWYNHDLTSQAKHFEPWVQPKIGFDNLIGSFYCNTLLKNLIKEYKLKIKAFTNHSQIHIKIPRITITEDVFYQKSNYYKKCKDIIKRNKEEELNENYYLMRDLCKNSPYINEEWYKVLMLMMSKMKNYKFEILQNDYFNLDTFEWDDYLICIGVECGIRN